MVNSNRNLKVLASSKNVIAAEHRSPSSFQNSETTRGINETPPNLHLHWYQRREKLKKSQKSNNVWIRGNPPKTSTLERETTTRWTRLEAAGTMGTIQMWRGGLEKAGLKEHSKHTHWSGGVLSWVSNTMGISKQKKESPWVLGKVEKKRGEKVY